MISGLLDHLWQSSLFAAFLGILTLTLRNNAAKIRCWIWFAASVKFLIPFSFLAAIAYGLISSPIPAPPPLPITSIITLAPQVFSAQQAVQPFAAAAPVWSSPAKVSSDLLVILAILWASGFLVITLTWLGRWAQINRLLRQGVSVPLPVPVPVEMTASSFGPGLFGILRPVMLLPEGIADHLSAEELNAVVAHELCHLHRRDNLVGAIHMLIQALFWFYPLIWWVGGRMIAERERACDEGVVEAGYDAGTYAEGILKICRFHSRSPLACAASIADANLEQRLETILDRRMVDRLGGVGMLLLAVSTTIVIASPILTGLVSPLQTVVMSEGTALVSPNEHARLLAEQALPRKAIPIDPRLFDRYVGYYLQNPQSLMNVTRSGQHFYVRFLGMAPVELYPESQTKFFAKTIVAQLSFELDSRSGVVFAVWHQGGIEHRADRVSVSEAKSIENLIEQRVKGNSPNPGTKGALRNFITALETGRLPTEIMNPWAIYAERDQVPWILQQLKKWGSLESITFQGHDVVGDDMYSVRFTRGEATWLMVPLRDGKIEGMGFWEVYLRTDKKHPSVGAAEFLHRFILEMAAGKPDYADIAAPNMVIAARNMLPGLRRSLQSSGPLQSLTFKAVDGDGMDIYQAVFAHGRSEWHISPLTADGKVQRLYSVP